MTSTIRINDLFDDLGEENKRLFAKNRIKQKMFYFIRKI
jgi:hypothetical protein